MKDNTLGSQTVNIRGINRATKTTKLVFIDIIRNKEDDIGFCLSKNNS